MSGSVGRLILSPGQESYLRINTKASFGALTDEQQLVALKTIAASSEDVISKTLYFEHIPVAKLLSLADYEENQFDEIIEHLRQFPPPGVEPQDRKHFVPSQPSHLANLMVAFSYFSAAHEPTNPWEALQQLQVYSLLLTAPFFGGLILDQLFDLSYVWGEQHAALAFTTALGFIILCSTAIKIYSYFTPVPSQLKPFRNYTSEVVLGKFAPLIGRDSIVEQVFSCWASSDRSTRQHPLLVGPAGVGKTSIMMEIARRIVSGDLPEGMKSAFKDKKFFGGPAALLLPSNPMFETDDKIDNFLRRIEPAKNEIILGLDEIHSFLTDQWVNRYGEVLKSMLDVSFKGLPYVICATTDYEYQRYIATDDARARRFRVIYVGEIDKQAALLILKETAMSHYSHGGVSPDFLEYIYDATCVLGKEFPHLRQPEIAKKILISCLAKIKSATDTLCFASDLPAAQIAKAQAIATDPFDVLSGQHRALSLIFKGVQEGLDAAVQKCTAANDPIRLQYFQIMRGCIDQMCRAIQLAKERLEGLQTGKRLNEQEILEATQLTQDSLQFIFERLEETQSELELFVQSSSILTMNEIAESVIHNLRESRQVITSAQETLDNLPDRPSEKDFVKVQTVSADVFKRLQPVYDFLQSVQKDAVEDRNALIQNVLQTSQDALKVLNFALKLGRAGLASPPNGCQNLPPLLESSLGELQKMESKLRESLDPLKEDDNTQALEAAERILGQVEIQFQQVWAQLQRYPGPFKTTPTLLQERVQVVTNANTTVETLKNIETTQRGQMEELKQLEKRLIEQKQCIHPLINKQGQSYWSNRNVIWKKELIFRVLFSIPELQGKIAELKRTLRLPTLDVEMVRKAIAEFRESLQKVKGNMSQTEAEG